ALAAAALGLLQDPARWQAAQAAGVARVERYYTQDLMVGSYRELYQRLMAQADDAAPDAARHGGNPARCPVHGGA
ncbi:MAG TPA: glycosyl transferase family 1, partial [Roseateles sp.]|nr:glycosyl transferase family 1 [Roseateles sp.]